MFNSFPFHNIDENFPIFFYSVFEKAKDNRGEDRSG